MQHQVKLGNDITVPALGLGTWYLGESDAARASEIEALRSGIEAGMTLVDTAEMYGGGSRPDRRGLSRTQAENLAGYAVIHGESLSHGDGSDTPLLFPSLFC